MSREQAAVGDIFLQTVNQSDLDEITPYLCVICEIQSRDFRGNSRQWVTFLRFGLDETRWEGSDDVEWMQLFLDSHTFVSSIDPEK